MSPRTMFHSCGASSRCERRRNLPEPGDPEIVRVGPLVLALGIVGHRPQLEDREGGPAEADPVLAEQGRAAVAPDQQREEGDQGGEEDQRRERDRDVEAALGELR